MKRTDYFSGQQVLEGDLEYSQRVLGEGSKERLTDLHTYGVVYDGISNFFMSFVLDGDRYKINVGHGVGYDSGGERILIDEDDTYNSSNTSHTIDGVSVPLSSGNLKIPLEEYTPGVVNNVWIEYLETKNPNVFELHPDTGQKFYVEVQDGYNIKILSTNPYNDRYNGAIFLGTITADGLTGTPTISYDNKEYLQPGFYRGITVSTLSNTVAVYGYSQCNSGVRGYSCQGYGMYGSSCSNAGIRGESSVNVGVYGCSPCSIGVIGHSCETIGVLGCSASGDGLRGVTCFTGRGVHGATQDGLGTSGFSINLYGAFGCSYNCYGIYGCGRSNYAIVGDTGLGTGNYGLYTADNLFAANKGSYISDAFINAENEDINTGDIVKLKGDPPSYFITSKNPKIPVSEVFLSDTEDDILTLGVVTEIAGSHPEDIEDNTSDDWSKIPSGKRLSVLTCGAFAHCKVETLNDAINIGDRLTSSNLKGRAKKFIEGTHKYNFARALESVPLGLTNTYISILGHVR